jgi:predicted amidohydrolase YtcJ
MQKHSVHPFASISFLTAVSLVLVGCASNEKPEKPGQMAAPSSPEIAPPGPGASTLYTGPRFITLDPDLPEAAALLVDAEGKILARYAEIPSHQAGWKVVELPGALALPGLHDAHVHIAGVGKNQESVNLLGAKSVEEVAARVQAFMKEHPDLAAITGRGWDQSRFENKAFPKSADLASLGDRIILLSRVDGHAALASQALMKAAGITAATPDPRGGRIERDAKGNPTGVFVDNAIELVARHLPEPTVLDRMRWLKAGMDKARDAGLVAAHDMGMSVEMYQALLALQAQGPLPIRMFVYLEGSQAGLAVLRDARENDLQQVDRVTLMGIKMLADGAMGSRGAALLEPYADDPKNSGLLTMELKIMAERLRRAQDLGFQVAIHAIGDRGNREVLAAFGENPPKKAGVFHRVEHAQLVHPDDFAAFSKLNAVASMQPSHATSDMRWAEARVGKERLAGAYAWRKMLENKVVLAFGSDAPVESIRPLWGIYAAISRQDHGGNPRGGFLPDQRLNAEEAISAYSLGAANALGKGGDLGSLLPGKSFDLTVLSEDSRKKGNSWLKTRIVATAVQGEIHQPAK